MVTKTEQKKINNNNRKRGSKFEKTTADILEMYTVPCSGSNTRYGLGDIRDCEGTKDGLWLGECKNITCDIDENGYVVYVIKREWLDDIERKAKEYGLMPFFAFMNAGKVHKWILLRGDIYDELRRKVANWRYIQMYLKSYELEKKSWNTTNLIFKEKLMINFTKLHGNEQWHSIRLRNVGDEAWYYWLSMAQFKQLLDIGKLHWKYRSDKNEGIKNTTGDANSRRI